MILKAPAEKLPLATRKNVRDEWESKKPEYEKEMKEILGETWTIDVNPNLIYEYAGDHKARLGNTLTWYFDPFVRNLKRFAEKFGSDGVQELNSVCSKHQLIFTPQEKTEFKYGGMTVEEGVLYLVFNEGSYCVNVDGVSDDFATALKNAAISGGASAFNIVARNAVREDYDSKINELHKTITGLLNMPNLKLNPNFEANSTELVKCPARVEEGWEKRIGFTTYEYFDALRYTLERENFKGDDMQQEAFQEAVDKGEVCIRIVPKLENSSSRYHELKLENGVLYMQSTSEHWGVNASDAFGKILDIL